MKKYHKILIAIGIVLVVTVMSGIVFQVNKTNQALAYTKQLQETKIATDYVSAINSIKDDKFLNRRSGILLNLS